MGIEIVILFSVYLDLLHWGKNYIANFTAVEEKITASFIAVM